MYSVLVFTALYLRPEKIWFLLMRGKSGHTLLNVTPIWDGEPGPVIREYIPGRAPTVPILKLYANGLALKAAREGKPMPYGAVIVKENYGKDQKTLMAITPMYKVKGYNPDAGDWFWAKYAPDGTVAKSGKVKGCIDCHRTQEDKDWLFTTPK